MGTWWIDKPFLLGSSNPSEDLLRDLYSQGFRVIVSLLDEAAQPPCYDPEHATALGFQRHSVPIPDFGAPSLDQLYEFLDKLATVPRGEQVLVHCEGGSGRTGTMAAAYWIAQGLAATEAIHKVREANPKAVEVPEQIQKLEEFVGELKKVRPEALATFRRLVALLYREIGVLGPRNHLELANKRRLESGFFATPARKMMAREVYQSTKRAPNPGAITSAFETLTGLSLDDTERAFREGDWKNAAGGYSYGGPKWAAIAQATLALRDAIANTNPGGMRRLLKDVDALEHNHGRITAKFPELGPD